MSHSATQIHVIKYRIRACPRPLFFSLSSATLHVPSRINPHLSFPGTQQHQGVKTPGGRRERGLFPSGYIYYCLVEIWIRENEFHCLLSFHALISGQPRKTKAKTWQKSRWVNALFTKWTLSPWTLATEACFSSLTSRLWNRLSLVPHRPKAYRSLSCRFKWNNVRRVLSNETMLEGCTLHVSES